MLITTLGTAPRVYRSAQKRAPESFADRVRQAPGLSTGQPRDPENPGYQQTAPAWDDPEGDAHLIRMLDRVPETIARGVWDYLARGRAWDRRGDDKPRPDFVPGTEPPLEIPALVNRMHAIVHKHSATVTPHIGPEHEWSAEAGEYQKWGFWRRAGDWATGKQDFPTPTLGRSKLFLTLSTGTTARFLTTGHEEELQSRLMARPDGSVELHELLEESYLLCGGDLYQTLLTAENVLAWDINDPERDCQPVQAKLSYLRNDEPEFGDNFGAWYHFTGIALYSLMRPDWMGKSVAAIESTGSLLMEGPDRQETFINKLGASFGSRLRELVESGRWRRPLDPDADTDYRSGS